MKVLGLWCILVVCWFALHAEAVEGGPRANLEEEEEEVMAEEEDLKGPQGQARTLLMEKYDEEPGNYCPRYSSSEVFHSHIHPHLLKILDERSYFLESVLTRLEESLHSLLLHHSPTRKARIEEVFPEVRRAIFGTMRDVYEVITAAWRDLANASPKDTLKALSLVRGAQQKGEARLVAVLQEFSITLRAIVLNSINVVQESLGLANDEGGLEAKAAIDRNLPKVAPNFLGALMSSILRGRSEPSEYMEILTDPFSSINPLVEQMYTSLQTLMENGSQTEEDMRDYWISAVDAAHQHLKESPLLQEDYETIFGNEEFLAESALRLLARTQPH